jgi:hypothetical protein
MEKIPDEFEKFRHPYTHHIEIPDSTMKSIVKESLAQELRDTANVESITPTTDGTKWIITLKTDILKKIDRER